MIRRFGDWQKVENLIRNLNKVFQNAGKNALNKITEEAQKRLIMHLNNQDLGWQTLSVAYKSQKERKGLASQMLVARGDLKNAIKTIVNNDVGFVGIRSGAKNTEGKSLEIIAATHEYGSITRNIPARKLWQPTNDEMKEWLNKSRFIEDIFLEELKKFM